MVYDTKLLKHGVCKYLSSFSIKNCPNKIKFLNDHASTSNANM